MKNGIDGERLNYRTLILVFILGVVFAIFLQKKEGIKSVLLTVPPSLPTEIHYNKLKLASNISSEPFINIVINEPVELDSMSKEDLLRMRKEYVGRYRDLIDGGYSPSGHLFGAIEGGKPWWGLEGEFCRGSGEHSIDGLSEESRFFANPFLLLGLDEGKAFCMEDRPCFAVYPHLKSILWYVSQKKAVITYDMSRFLFEKKELHFETNNITLFLENYNARDFGFNYIFASPLLSKGLSPISEGGLLKGVCVLNSFIHLGSSCGYPGGCNNASPYQPQLYFKLEQVPATLYCKLWQKIPKNSEQEADFVYIINLE